MTDSPPVELSLHELAERAGVPPRTVRYYIARGLMEGPSGPGRAASYGARHLERLEEIRRLKAEGRSLNEIKRRLGEGGAPPEAPEPTSWWSYRLGDDVVVNVSAGASPWRLKQIQQALAEMAERLGGEDEGKGNT